MSRAAPLILGACAAPIAPGPAARAGGILLPAGAAGARLVHHRQDQRLARRRPAVPRPAAAL